MLISNNYMSKNWIVMEWIVEKFLWWWDIKVLVGNNLSIFCKLSWNMKKNKIKVILWDEVEVSINEYDPKKWMIIKRL